MHLLSPWVGQGWKAQESPNILWLWGSHMLWLWEVWDCTIGCVVYCASLGNQNIWHQKLRNPWLLEMDHCKVLGTDWGPYRSFVWFMCQCGRELYPTRAYPGHRTLWMRGGEAAIILADVIIPSPQLTIEKLYSAQLGCHPGLLTHSWTLTRAPWPHPHLWISTEGAVTLLSHKGIAER